MKQHDHPPHTHEQCITQLYVIMAYLLKALIQQEFFNFLFHTTISRPNPSDGLRVVLTQLCSELKDTLLTSRPLSNLIRNHENLTKKTSEKNEKYELNFFLLDERSNFLLL